MSISGTSRGLPLYVVERGSIVKYIGLTTSPQSIPNSEGPTLTLAGATLSSDVGGITRNNGVLTIPTAGSYLISVITYFAQNTTGYRGFGYRKNGGVSDKSILKSPVAGEPSTSLNISIVDDFDANDTIEFYVFQNSGGSLNVNRTDFSITRLN